MGKRDIIKVKLPRRLEIEIYPVEQLDESPSGEEICGVPIYLHCGKLESLSGTRAAVEYGLQARDALMAQLKKRGLEATNIASDVRKEDDGALYYYFEIHEPDDNKLKSKYRNIIQQAALTVQSELDRDKVDAVVTSRARKEALIAEALKPFNGQIISDETIPSIAVAVQDIIEKSRRKSR